MTKDIAKKHYFKIFPKERKRLETAELLSRIAGSHGNVAEKFRQDLELKKVEEEFNEWLDSLDKGDNDNEPTATKRSA